MRPYLFLLLAACSGSTGTGNDSKDPAAVNHAPVAEAGAPITQTADAPVTLSGAGSSDPDGDPITYHWTFDHLPEGSALATKEAPFSPNHTADGLGTVFMPDVLGTYVVQLVVKDNKGLESPADFVVVTISAPENLPVANAGVDQTGRVGTAVNLSGAASFDPLGRDLTYSWSVLAKPTTSSLSALSGSNTAAASYTPDSAGVYTFGLVVNNGLVDSVADAVNVTVIGLDNAPVANAGPDQTTEDCTSVQLDCSGSQDPDNDTLTYQWEVQSKPSNSQISNASFSDRTAARPTFFPDQAGTYTLSCSAYDGSSWSSPDQVNIVAADRRTNTPPLVDAGTSEILDGGTAECVEDGYVYDCEQCSDQTYVLGRSASITDADLDPYTIQWTVEEGDATLADPTSLVTSVTLEDAAPTEPLSCETVDYKFRLTAVDCTGATVSDVVTISVSCCGVADSTP